MSDNRNMMLAIFLSILILVGYELLFKPAVVPVVQTGNQQTTQTQNQPQSRATPAGSVPEATSDVPSASPGSSASQSTVSIPSAITQALDAATDGMFDRSGDLASGQRIAIESDRIRGSISLTGGRIDDLELIDYREELDPESHNIVVLRPKGQDLAYYAEFGWVPSSGSTDIALPGADTVWRADSKTLTQDRPLVLRWDNGQGQVFSKIISLDENYMFTIAQSVDNSSSRAVSLHPYGLISRRTTPETTGFYILHEGLLGVFDETLEEIDYDDLQEAGTIKQSTTGGWLGITDKYWLAALVPDQAISIDSRFIHRMDNGADKYQVDYLSEAVVAPAGGSVEVINNFFAGAKEVKLLDGYEEELGVKRFDLAIDFGWFYFLTKPIFYALLWLHSHVGNLGVSILLLTVGIKICFYPLANKSYVSMSKMKKLQPKMVELRERYGDDKVKLNGEMMALYKREKANPAAGCLPILIQIPVFFSLYKVLFVTIEMRHAPFFGWIQDLSAPDPTTVFNLFGMIPWTPPDFLMIGIWPLIMGISMYLQQKLNPQPADPMQAKIFLFMPIMFTFLLATFPAGLVIYWAWNNSLSILQQWTIMRRMGVKV